MNQAIELSTKETYVTRNGVRLIFLYKLKQEIEVRTVDKSNLKARSTTIAKFKFSLPDCSFQINLREPSCNVFICTREIVLHDASELYISQNGNWALFLNCPFQGCGEVLKCA